MTKPKLVSGITLIVFAIALTPAVAIENGALRLDFDKPGWELAGEGAVIEEFDGELALRLLSGSATYRGLEFLDGTISFDLQVTPYRSFAYLYFRMESDDEHEEFYFRPHKSLLPDAIQYTPVYKGSSQWQLYHDAQATAAARFTPGEWIPIKVVIEGTRAAVFVGGAEEPQLVVKKLARSPKPGYFALRSFMAFGTPPDTYVANFANVVVQPGTVDYEFQPAGPAETTEPAKTGAVAAGHISNWEVSPAFEPAEGPVLALPPDTTSTTKWTRVPAGSNGLVELERYLVRPEGVRRAAVLARVRLAAEAAVTQPIQLGFSDEVSVFLNGRLLLTDDESYSFNFPRREGLWSPGQLSLYLPLEKGVNELVLSVTDRFGGWAVSGRLEPKAGVKLEGAE